MSALTTNYLASLGVSMQEALAFVLANLSNPKDIYDTCVKHGISSQMLAEIVEGAEAGVDANAVRNFFSTKGFDGVALDLAYFNTLKAKSNLSSYGAINDTITLGDGNDLVDSGLGNDTINGNGGMTIEGEREGVCAKTVREKKAFLIDDVTVKEPDTDTDTGINWPEIYVESTPNIHSELCVPLLISGAAIGVVNLEHKAVDRYKGHDLNFVQSAVNLACKVIDNRRTGCFAKSMLEFAEKYTTLSAQAVEEQLRNRLHEYCYFSALAILEPTDTNDLTKVWRLVGDIDLRLDNGNKEALTKDLENIDGWERTWLHKLCSLAAWKNGIGAAFTDDPNDFQSIALGTQSGEAIHQKADPILWLQEQALRHHP